MAEVALQLVGEIVDKRENEPAIKLARFGLKNHPKQRRLAGARAGDYEPPWRR